MKSVSVWSRMTCFLNAGSAGFSSLTLGDGEEGAWRQRGEGLGEQGMNLFSLVKEEYNQRFVFRMLCNILEWDIGVFRDLV